MDRLKWRRLAGGVTMTLLLAGHAVHATPPAVSAAITARQANYKEIGGDFKAITDELKSGSPDVATIRSSVQDLYSRASAQLKYFVKGSGPESGMKTRAKAAIWSDEATFTGLQTDMVAAAESLRQLAANGDVAAITSARTKLGAACKACHDKFREPE